MRSSTLINIALVKPVFWGYWLLLHPQLIFVAQPFILSILIGIKYNYTSETSVISWSGTVNFWMCGLNISEISAAGWWWGNLFSSMFFLFIQTSIGSFNMIYNRFLIWCLWVWMQHTRPKPHLLTRFLVSGLLPSTPYAWSSVKWPWMAKFDHMHR